MTAFDALRRFSAVLMAAGALASTAQAGAPQVKTQAPGYYRLMLGAFEVTALSDGTVDLPVDKLLTQARPGQVQRALAKAILKPPVESSVNAYLINTGAQLVLVDTGAAGLFGPTLGKLLANLKAAGYQPEQVDAVLITHVHPDHIGGLVVDGRPAFPNATVHVDRRDVDYWLSPQRLAQAPADTKGFFEGAQASLGPVQAAGRLRPFDGDTELLPGIRAQASHGHTEGHTTFIIESQGQKLALWGDLLHVAAVQFDDPAVTIAFDTDRGRAAAERQKAFADAARGGYWVAASHLSFPGLGHVRREGSGFAFIPANYSAGR